MAHYRKGFERLAGRDAVVNLARMAVRAALGATGAAAAFAPPAFATAAWMSEEAMRTAFIGKTLDGHYVNGDRWTETYAQSGRLDYSESVRKGVGYWYFRGRVFCTFYDPGQGFNGGCFTAVQPSANCYEFYLAGLTEPEAESAPGPLSAWVARAWRRGEPSTCEARPSV
jgi:hypothetical protein